MINEDMIKHIVDSIMYLSYSEDDVLTKNKIVNQELSSVLVGLEQKQPTTYDKIVRYAPPMRCDTIILFGVSGDYVREDMNHYVVGKFIQRDGEEIHRWIKDDVDDAVAELNRYRCHTAFSTFANKWSVEEYALYFCENMGAYYNILDILYAKGGESRVNR